MTDYRFLEKIKDAEASANERLEKARADVDAIRQKARDDSDRMIADAWNEMELRHSERMAESEQVYRKMLARAAAEEYKSMLDDKSARRLGAKLSERIVELIGRR